MKQLIFLFFIALAFTACKEDDVCKTCEYAVSSTPDTANWLDLGKYCNDDLNILENYESLIYESTEDFNQLDSITGQNLDIYNYTGALNIRCN